MPLMPDHLRFLTLLASWPSGAQQCHMCYKYIYTSYYVKHIYTNIYESKTLLHVHVRAEWYDGDDEGSWVLLEPAECASE